MKIAIFGYPRSGTTMLNYIIKQHLINAGVVEEWAGVGEIFNPIEGTRLLITRNGHLVNLTNLTLENPQSREERLRLFKEHLDDDYVIKMMPYDTTLDGVVETVVQAGYNIIAVERRNPLAAFLSALIAYHHQVWNIVDDNDKPVYEPFTVSEQEMYGLSKSMAIYHNWRDKLNPSALLYYEDMVAQSTADTLKQAGLYQEGAEINDSPTKKLLTFEEKTKLILNLDEVIEHLDGILIAYAVNAEYNNL